MGLELFQVHFMTLLSSDHTFSYNLPNFCKEFHRRTSVGKIYISCQRPFEKNYFQFLGRTSAGKITIIARRTSAGKKCITCRRPCEKNYLPYLGRTSVGKTVYLQTSFQTVICLDTGHRQDKKHCRRPFNLRL